MSFRNNRKRSLSSNSSILLSRRSSINPKDMEYIQNMMQRTKRTSKQMILFFLIALPVFIFSYQFFLIQQNERFLKRINTSLNSTTFFRVKSLLESQFLSLIPWIILLLLVQIQLLCLWFIPAMEKELVTNFGDRFYSRENSFDSCVLICLVYLLGCSIGLYDGELIFVQWPGIMFALSVFAFTLQFYLFLYWRNGSSTCESNTSEEDWSSSGTSQGASESGISEIFFGRHLQPIIFHIDVKAFITQRVTFTLWPLYIISSIFHYKLTFGQWGSVSLITCSSLQLCNILRIQYLEHLRSNLDNQTDRVGFYRLWGYLVFLPTIYLTPITILAQTNKKNPGSFCAFIFILNLFLQYLNSRIDQQKQDFRKSDGNWKLSDGQDAFYIRAKYRKENGDWGTELLLGSGYWGIARHLNYTTEFLIYFSWSLTAFWNPVVYLPVIFIAICLYGRMARDEARCLMKYSHYWLQYTQKVPYMILPGLY